MLRDASQKQVIQKFSFIESLKISRKTKVSSEIIPKGIEVEPAFNFIPQVNPKSNKETPEKLASALVATGSIDADFTRGAIVPHSTNNGIFNREQPQNPGYLGKIFFALAISYCLFVLWWLFGYQGNKMLVRLLGGRHIEISKSDLEFIDSLEDSLNILDRQLEAEKTAQGGDKEVVYIPVYTPKSNTPNMLQIPAAPANPAPTEALKIPTPPPLPAPTPVAEESTTQAKIATAITEPQVKHTLMGILELGEGKSAALININGQTRRFWLGEEIGSSGWILESITNRTAQISDRQKVRSIGVGDTF